MSTEGNVSRDAYGRGVPMTKRELVKAASLRLTTGPLGRNRGRPRRLVRAVRGRRVRVPQALQGLPIVPLPLGC